MQRRYVKECGKESEQPAMRFPLWLDSCLADLPRVRVGRKLGPVAPRSCANRAHLARPSLRRRTSTSREEEEEEASDKAYTHMDRGARTRYTTLILRRIGSWSNSFAMSLRLFAALHSSLVLI